MTATVATFRVFTRRITSGTTRLAAFTKLSATSLISICLTASAGLRTITSVGLSVITNLTPSGLIPAGLAISAIAGLGTVTRVLLVASDFLIFAASNDV